MPEGILIIDWDEFEGGYVSYKYPDLKIPDNLEVVNISKSFNCKTTSGKKAIYVLKNMVLPFF